jgi:hypothetical protein
MVSMLETVGRLVGFSRQLDTQMQNEESVDYYLNAFYEQNSKLTSNSSPAM